MNIMCVFFFQAEDGIRDLVRSRGLGDVYKRQMLARVRLLEPVISESTAFLRQPTTSRPTSL